MDPQLTKVGRPRVGLPRASGDGPGVLLTAAWRLPAAPRERGWTRRPECLPGRLEGCPARAGMDPTMRPGQTMPMRLPRASGDGPLGPGPARRSRWAAPRERGWTRPHATGRICSRAVPRERGWTYAVQAVAHCRGGCPARAGMDPWATAAISGWVRLPRASGDGPPGIETVRLFLAAAPRERGWTRQLLLACPLRRGCPARAGMDPPRRPWPLLPARLPRASGDGPPVQAFAQGLASAAPRERGSIRLAGKDPRRYRQASSDTGAAGPKR